jgi:glyoxylase-like metal-dependent hydrolase (beta-lactamase superfamily II)
LYTKVVAAVTHISSQSIRYVVNTHWHWDHVGADSNFARAGAAIISSNETREYIVAAQGANQANRGAYVRNPLAVPTVTVGTATLLHLAGQTVEIIHAPPAHTDGDLIVRFVEADVLQTGDTFLHGLYPDIDFRHGGTIDGMIAFADALYNLCDAHTKVIPGHGPVADREDIREYQTMLRKVRNRVAQAIAAGMSEEALIASHPLDDLDKVWGGNLIKRPYLLSIVYEDLKSRH